MSAEVERVARAVQQAFYEGGGYDGMAAAAMTETLLIAAEALRKVAQTTPYEDAAHNQTRTMLLDVAANWLTARAQETTDGIA
jgi:hypothetical protein